MQALDGITILDLTHMLSGPYGTMLLTDLGARTIKIEPPGRGEGTRELLKKHPDYSRGDMGAYFLTLNRGKESVCIDLKSEQGHAVFLDLVRKADIVFDNFSPGVTKRLQIDHESLIQVNPGIITCSVTGFGSTGPDVDRPAFDQVVQAMGGGMSITGEADRSPMRAGIPIGDLGGGVFGALGVLAALQARARTGHGQHVDVSMLDVQVSLLNYMATMHLMSGHVPDRISNSHFVHVPYNAYPTRDGYVIVACIGDAFFERFLDVLPDPRLRLEAYRTQPGRYADKGAIDAIIADAFVAEDTDIWLSRLRAARIPCGPVNDLAHALSDPQILARDMVIEVPLPEGGSVRMPGNPVKLSGASGPHSHRMPPPLAEHTDTVLTELLGYAPDAIEALRQAKAIS